MKKWIKDLMDASFIVAVFSFITTAVSYLIPNTEKQLVIYFMIFIITSWMKEVR